MRTGEERYAATRFRQTAARLYRILDGHLATHAHVAGDDYSIADMAMYPWTRYLQRHGLDPADFPALTAWQATIVARPAVQKAAAMMQEWGCLNTADRLEATQEDGERFGWRHFPDPGA